MAVRTLLPLALAWLLAMPALAQGRATRALGALTRAQDDYPEEQQQPDDDQPPPPKLKKHRRYQPAPDLDQGDEAAPKPRSRHHKKAKVAPEDVIDADALPPKKKAPPPDDTSVDDVAPPPKKAPPPSDDDSSAPPPPPKKAPPPSDDDAKPPEDAAGKKKHSDDLDDDSWRDSSSKKASSDDDSSPKKKASDDDEDASSKKKHSDDDESQKSSDQADQSDQSDQGNSDSDDVGVHAGWGAVAGHPPNGQMIFGEVGLPGIRALYLTSKGDNFVYGGGGEIDFPPLSFEGHSPRGFNAIRFVGRLDYYIPTDVVQLYVRFEPQWIAILGDASYGGLFYMPVEGGVGFDAGVLHFGVGVGAGVQFTGSSLLFPFTDLIFSSPFVGVAGELPINDSMAITARLRVQTYAWDNPAPDRAPTLVGLGLATVGFAYRY